MFSIRALSNEFRRKSSTRCIILLHQQQGCCLQRGSNNARYNQQQAASRQCKRYTHNSNNNNKNTSSRLQSLKSNGTPEILFGSTILLLALVDYILQQNQNDIHNNDDIIKSQMMADLQSQISTDATSFHKQTKEKLKKQKKEILFQCKVKRLPVKFDGHKCLTGVQVGDVLNVIEEGVGPGGLYNLCFVKNNTIDSGDDEEDISLGWFPCSCLEVMKE